MSVSRTNRMILGAAATVVSAILLSSWATNDFAIASTVPDTSAAGATGLLVLLAALVAACFLAMLGSVILYHIRHRPPDAMSGQSLSVELIWGFVPVTIIAIAGIYVLGTSVPGTDGIEAGRQGIAVSEGGCAPGRAVGCGNPRLARSGTAAGDPEIGGLCCR